MNKKIIYLSLYLAIITLLSGLILFGFDQLTRPKIEYQKQLKIKLSLKQVFPSASSFVQTKDNIFNALSGDNKIGVILKVVVKGYGGSMPMLVGIKNNKIMGVKILEHTETPGLGAIAVENKHLTGKSFSFLGQFKMKNIRDKFKAKEDVVAITGATITSQAIADGVKQAISLYKSLK